MTQLYFRYNTHYDYMLARLTGESFDWQHMEKEGFDFRNKITEHWGKYNDNFFDYYKGLGLALPSFWIAYSVHMHKGLIPFSDPLTVLIKENIDDVTATLVHELCHVFLTHSENSEIWNKLYKYINQEFVNEDWDTKVHLITNPLAAAGLINSYGVEEAQKLLAIEKKYEGLERAWEIIDNAELKFEDPIKEILSLKIN